MFLLGFFLFVLSLIVCLTCIEYRILLYRVLYYPCGERTYRPILVDCVAFYQLTRLTFHSLALSRELIHPNLHYPSPGTSIYGGFVVQQAVRRILYNKSTTNRSYGIWSLVETARVRYTTVRRSSGVRLRVYQPCPRHSDRRRG